MKTRMPSLEEVLGTPVEIDDNKVPVVECELMKAEDLLNKSIHMKIVEPIAFPVDLLYGEYRNLCRMYTASPDYVARPYAMIKDRAGSYIGYLVEKIGGKDLDRLRRKLLAPRDAADIRKNVLAGLAQINAQGIGHGDLDRSNIVAYRNREGALNIKLIDPAPSFNKTDDARNIKRDSVWLSDFSNDYWEDKDLRFASVKR